MIANPPVPSSPVDRLRHHFFPVTIGAVVRPPTLFPGVHSLHPAPVWGSTCVSIIGFNPLLYGYIDHVGCHPVRHGVATDLP